MNCLLRKIIRGYQRFISPILGARCRFHPSCSRYAYECFEQFGFFRAGAKSLLRILKCHPFHSGGFDPVKAKPASEALVNK